MASSTLNLDQAADEFAGQVGVDGEVAIEGLATRGGAVGDVRTVAAPSGIEWIQPAEMTIRCGARTPVEEVDSALAEYGQCVAVPGGGTIGGALSVGRNGIRRLGYGPMRDVLLQAHYVSAKGEVVKVGGPTVKNVSGFDLCRLLVGSRGTLGFVSDVILRTRPRGVHEQWFSSDRDPWDLLTELYRPTSVLWDGETTWVLLEGHADDIRSQAESSGLQDADGPPALPTEARWSLPPSELPSLRIAAPGSFVAEIGVGIVHHTHPAAVVDPDFATVELHRRIKSEFDPKGRLNPGVSVLRTS
jgi:glycolate oxidase FAD binding subunit